ncbi:MAG: tyrosine-type recombinase/integrase [Desulfofustis sp. PB-SRB1]|nr:tyrosine-type recombinase/integrase [Desulfofustis sp. PB-SRB1]
MQLTVHDVDLKDKVLHIRKGKGNRQRVVPIGKNAATYLQEYLENIRPRYARKNKQQRRLFLTDQGRPVTGNSIRTSLFHYKKAAGITKTASPHSFRRSCATHLLQQGLIFAMSRSCWGTGISGPPKSIPEYTRSTSRKLIPGRIQGYEDQSADTGLSGRTEDPEPFTVDDPQHPGRLECHGSLPGRTRG